MPSLSTHVLDGAAGGPVVGVEVDVHDMDGHLVGSGVTDGQGRVEALAGDLDTGTYRITWHLGGFVVALAATLGLGEERPYHVPVLVSGHSAVVYLGV